MKEIETEMLIIGSGAAGLTAAIYAGRANKKPVLLAGDQPGGQLTITTDVENFPGFEHAVQGPELMAVMRKQAERCGGDIRDVSAIKVDFSQAPYKITTSDETAYHAKTVIIATGAQAKWLETESERKFRGFGVSACATCDGFFFRGLEVAVVGGGNTAAEEALFLTNFAKKVHLIHRRDKMRAEAVLQDKVFAHPKIAFIGDSVVEEVIGEDNPKKVTGLRLKNVKDGSQTDLSVEGLFVAIGHKPNTDIFKDVLPLDAEGYISVPPGATHTEIPGVFAAGDVSDKIYRQAVTAAGAGCMAALDAVRYLDQ